MQGYPKLLKPKHKLPRKVFDEIKTVLKPFEKVPGEIDFNLRLNRQNTCFVELNGDISRFEWITLEPEISNIHPTNDDVKILKNSTLTIANKMNEINEKILIPIEKIHQENNIPIRMCDLSGSDQFITDTPEFLDKLTILAKNLQESGKKNIGIGYTNHNPKYGRESGQPKHTSPILYLFKLDKIKNKTKGTCLFKEGLPIYDENFEAKMMQQISAIPA